MESKGATLRTFSPAHVVLLTTLAASSAFGQANLITTVAGSNALGAGYAGDGAAATAAQISAPSGVAVDSAGNIYISDFGNNVVRMVSAATGFISTYAGTPGVSGNTGDNGLATFASLSGPTGLAIDSAGNLYIADAIGYRIRKVGTNGIITTVAGGSPGFGGDGGPANQAQLNYPSGVAVDSSGNIYIADLANSRVRKVSNGIISTVAGIAYNGYNADNILASLAQLNLPRDVAVDSTGNVYIADTGNNRIRKITVSSNIITTVAGNGTAGYAGDHGLATSAQINGPWGIWVDAASNIYIADTGNNVIRKVSGTSISTVAGTGTAGFGGDTGPAVSALLNKPEAIVVDSTGGNSYVADNANNVIRQFTNTVISGVLPHFAAGGSFVTGFYLFNKSATQASNYTITFYNDAGNLVSLPISGGGTSSSVTGTIPALGAAYVEVGNISSATPVGGSATVAASASVVTQALIRHLSTAGIYYEASVPSTNGNLEVESSFDFTTFTPTGAQIYTGLGVANLDAAATATVTCTARDSSGNPVANAIPTMTIPPLGHTQGYNYTALFGLRGTLDCVSTTKTGMIALRFLGNDAFSAFPIIPIK